MSTIVTANDDTQIDLDNAAQSFTYSGGFVATIVVVYRGNTYTQTFTNNGTNITAISNWVAS